MSDFNYPIPIKRMIVATRKIKGLDQIDLANHSGVKRTYISRIETGDALPTPDQLAAIEAALGIHFNDPAVQAAFAVLLGSQPTNGDSNA